MPAIYQQARPVTFDQVVGQEHVKEVLVASLTRGRVGHAYLFSGPRGVGKTTSARLLAMAVNCEAEVAVRPCGRCESCRLVRANSHPDVIELDAASNNSVEDVREIRDQVRLSAIRGGMRVWVLDEAHMLSRAAANALLKTLEEPPPQLVFILATTEPEKLPPTILSRCQHFRFRRLSEIEIEGKLRQLCERAEVEAEDAALTLVAKAADGAMRDAESLLERLLASGEPITQQDAEDALGLPPQTRLQALATALASGDTDKLLAEAGGLYRDGFAPRSLAEQLQETLRDALYTKVGIGAGFGLDLSETDLLRVIHALDDEAERFVRRDDLFSLEVALIKALNALRHNVPSDAVADLSAPVAQTQTAQTQTAQAQIAQARPVQPQPAQQPADPRARDFNPNQSTPSRPARGAAATQQPAPQPKRRGDWRDVQRRAPPHFKAFLMPAHSDIDGQTIKLVYPKEKSFHFAQTKRLMEQESEFISIVGQVFGDGYTLEVRHEGSGDVVRKKL